MSTKDLFATVQSLKELERRRLELEAKYKREQQRIKDRDKYLVTKLKAARTHMVMETTPQLIKALGYTHLLNISLEDINQKPQLLEKLQGEKSFNAVFEDLENVMIALTDIIYNRPEIKAQLQGLVADMTGLEAKDADGTESGE